MRLQWMWPVLLGLGLALGPINAGATLLYAGGEDVDFYCLAGGTCSVDTAAQTFRSGWAREAYHVLGTTSDPPTNRFASAVFSPVSTLWLHAQYCNAVSFFPGCDLTTASGAQMIRIMDSSGNPTLIVRGTGTSGQLKISSRTAGGTFTDLVTCSSAIANTLQQLDVYVNYGTSGEVTLYNNSVQVCDYTGNVTNGDGATTLNQIEFSAAHVTGNSYGNWSEVIVATTDTRGMARFTANTTGNGNTTSFSGTNVCSSIWSATAFNDANYGFSGSNNAIQECTINSAVPAGSYSVLGLVMSARVLVGTTGPQHFDFVTRTGGTDYMSSDFAPITSFTNITNYIQTTNPATSTPWALSDFQAAGFNVGEETKP